jgi:hypothetical protein
MTQAWLLLALSLAWAYCLLRPGAEFSGLYDLTRFLAFYNTVVMARVWAFYNSEDQDLVFLLMMSRARAFCVRRIRSLAFTKMTPDLDLGILIEINRRRFSIFEDQGLGLGFLSVITRVQAFYL